jgi:hypothetical protein
MMKKYLQYVTSRKTWKENLFLLDFETSDEKSRLRIRYLVYRSKDPDPYQNVVIRNTGLRKEVSVDGFFMTMIS